MLPFILIMSMLCQGHAVDYGTDFVTAFPENLAYYFPKDLNLYLKITTFVPATNITIFNNTAILCTKYVDSPQVSVFNIPGAVEVNQFGLSGNTVRITSNKNITVLSYSQRGDSIQSNIVPPTTNLGLEYLVPYPDYTDLAVQMNTYNYSVPTGSTIVPMDFSFRLLIINAVNVSNIVTVTQQTPTGPSNVYNLDPFQLILLPSGYVYYKVSSKAEVVVILTNPCIDTQNCRCNLVSHQLRPSSFQGTEFIVPPYNATYRRLFVTSDNTVSLGSGSLQQTVASGSGEMLPFLPGLANGSPRLTTSQPAWLRVIMPGLIIDVLPKDMFSSCYLVHTNLQVGVTHKALIIVNTAQADSVQMGTAPLSVANWNDIIDIGYSWAEIDLTNCQKSCVIWHPTTKILVYVFETSLSGVIYGGPAISLNDEPDPNGCVVFPTEYQLSNVTMSWQAARAYCINKGLVLASPNIEFTQDKMEASLKQMNAEGDMWLGLRRNLVTSDWYWHSSADFSFTNWNYSQPSGSLCVSIMMEPGGNFTWNSERCCSSMLPLCAKQMVIVGSVTDLDSQAESCNI